MSLILIVFAAYLTYYTFQYGRQMWKESKFSAFSIFFLSVIFLPLAIYVEYLK